MRMYSTILCDMMLCSIGVKLLDLAPGSALAFGKLRMRMRVQAPGSLVAQKDFE